MWIAGQITTSSVGFLFATLGGVPLTMIATGFVIYRLNAVYESVRPGERHAPQSRSAWNVSLSEERAPATGGRGRPRPLVDVAMTASAVTALVLLLVWFFFIAEMQLAPMG